MASPTWLSSAANAIEENLLVPSLDGHADPQLEMRMALAVAIPLATAACQAPTCCGR